MDSVEPLQAIAEPSGVSGGGSGADPRVEMDDPSSELGNCWVGSAGETGGSVVEGFLGALGMVVWERKRSAEPVRHFYGHFCSEDWC